MNIITERTLIRELPDSLRAAWLSPGGWMRILQDEPDTEKIYTAVSALDLETATREDVVAAMRFNGGGWIDVPDCDECGKKSPALVVCLAERSDIDNGAAYVCVECLQKAVNLALASGLA